MDKLQAAQTQWQGKLAVAQGQWVQKLHQAQVAWAKKVSETHTLIANAATENVNDYHKKVSTMHQSLRNDETWGSKCASKVWVPIPVTSGHTRYAPVCYESVKGLEGHQQAPPPIMVDGMPTMVGPAPHATPILATTMAEALHQEDTARA